MPLPKIQDLEQKHTVKTLNIPRPEEFLHFLSQKVIKDIKHKNLRHATYPTGKTNKKTPKPTTTKNPTKPNQTNPTKKPNQTKPTNPKPNQTKKPT